MTVTLLNRDVYALSEAARLLRVPDTTLFWWLDGGRRRRKTYPPVIRPEATGSRYLTWAEFVEARYLRAYRREHEVRLDQLRAFIDQLRNVFDVPYPLAHFKPLVAGRDLVLKAQEQSALPPQWWMFVKAGGQVLASPASEDFLAHVEFDDEASSGWVRRIYPLGRNGPVVIDPAVSFGSPTIRGIRTEALAELLDAGEPAEDIAEMYGLTVGDLKKAVSYEWLNAG